MKLTDVRRLTGANFLMDRPGAAAEAVLCDEQKGIAVALWRRHMRDLLHAVGLGAEQIAVRSYPGGASLMTSAPIDALYAATSMIERAWEATESSLTGGAQVDLAQAAEELRDMIETERNPALIALAAAAAEHGVTFLGGDENASIGLGRGCKIWPRDAVPSARDIDWAAVHDVPVAMVTGTNGKSTTVRLTAAIGATAGRTVGQSSSDWVRVGREIVDEGDYSGPAGARLAVRDERVDLAVIETARGGLMRRGLPIPRADACLITNIAADHLGDYGINDVAALGDAKFMISGAVKPGGRLVLNGDDPELVSRSVGFAGDITWCGLSLEPRALTGWLDGGGHAAFVRDGTMFLARDGEQSEVLPVADFSPSMGGAARFNTSNALGAIALASALDLPVAAMTEALSGFEATPEENPGRGNFLEIGGVKILVDFAHNPHGVAALAAAVKDVPAKRRLFLLGQAGDRSDEDICEMTRAVWDARPDMIIVKELETKLRGRELGEIPAVIVGELGKLGAPSEGYAMAGTEMDSVHKALEWARPGDFVVLLIHADRKPAMTLLNTLERTNWRAGDPLPGEAVS
jgi:UDP-N-acetylmuramyl tripeptide synthase